MLRYFTIALSRFIRLMMAMAEWPGFLMNLILMRAGFPPVVIKLQNREPYIAALRRADVGENEGIVSFIGQNLLDAENLYVRGATGESIRRFR